MKRLKKRKDYVKVARGARTPRRGFLLQSTRRDAGAKAVVEDGPRFGFTVTKKIGNAVVRNRIRRRLKEAVRLAGAAAAEGNRDLVLVGRRPALDMPFDELLADVVGAVKSACGEKRGQRRAEATKGARGRPSEEEPGL